MGFTLRFQQSASIALAALLALPTSALAQTPLAKVPAVSQPPAATLVVALPVDVTLESNGVLQGYVVDGQGIPAGGVKVQLTSSDGQSVTTLADASGRFGYRGLTGGSYQLETTLGVVQCRVWTAQAAPPRSATTLLVIHDKQWARGQHYAPPAVNGMVGRMKRVMTNPFAVAAIIGAAVAIPVAIHNANIDNKSS